MSIPTIEVGYYVNLTGGRTQFVKYNLKSESLEKIQETYVALLHKCGDSSSSLDMRVKLDSQRVEFYDDGKFVKSENLELGSEKGSLLNTLSDVAKKELGDLYKPSSHTFVEGLRGPVKSDRQQFASVGKAVFFKDSRLEKRRRSIEAAQDFIDKELPDMLAKDSSLDKDEVEGRVVRADELILQQKSKLEYLLHEIEKELVVDLDTYPDIKNDSGYEKFSDEKTALKKADIALMMATRIVEKKEKELKQAVENSQSTVDRLKQELTSYKKALKKLQTTRNDIEGLVDFQKRVEHVDKLAVFWAAVHCKDSETENPEKLLSNLGKQRSKLRQHISSGGEHKVHGINIEEERLWIHDVVSLAIEDGERYQCYCTSCNVPLSAPSIEEYFVRLSKKSGNGNIDEIEELKLLKEHLLMPATGNTITQAMRNRLKDALSLPPAGGEVEMGLMSQ